MAPNNKDFIRIECANCGYKMRIPHDYDKPKGRCPKCKNVIDIGRARDRFSDSPESPPGKDDGVHPAVYLTVKHLGSLKKYGEDLLKIYALIRQQFVNREEYEKQKLILRKQVFTPIIEDAAQVQDFDWKLQDRIDLWQLVFSILPYTYRGKDPDVIFHLYERYDYAAMISATWFLAGHPDTRLKSLILRKTVRGERNTPKMKELFTRIIDSGYGQEFRRRIQLLNTETHTIANSAPEGLERDYAQTQEDFSFGIGWALLNIPMKS